MHFHQTLNNSVVLTRVDLAESMQYILLVGTFLVVLLGDGHEVGTLNNDLLVELDAAFLDYEELVQREILLCQDHFTFLAFADHYF